MEASCSISILESDTGGVFYAVTTWQAHDIPAPTTSSLCSLLILLTPGTLLHTPTPLTLTNFNSQLDQTDFFFKMRGVLSTQDPSYRYSLLLDEDESAARLEISAAIDEVGGGFVWVFRCQLERKFVHDIMGEFMLGAVAGVRVLEVSDRKREINDKNRRIEQFDRLDTLAETTAREVSVMREETGVHLAAQVIYKKFIGILNDHKEKLMERGIAPDKMIKRN